MYEKTHLTLGAVTIVAVILALITYIVSIVTGIVAITFTPFRDLLLSVPGHPRVGAFLVPDWPTPIYTNLLVLCYSFIGIFILCFWLATRNENGTSWGLKSIRRGTRPVGLPNWLAVMPLVSSPLLLVVYLLTLLLASGGVAAGNLPQPITPEGLARLFAGVIYAPIDEEMAYRITVLGVLVGLRMIWNAVKVPQPMRRWLRLKGFLLALYSPESAKAKLGLPRIASSGWRGIHWTEWAVLITTSVLFGLAHVLYGAGWEAGKAVTAGLSGLALGLVYLTYGAFANILLHWFFNFYFLVFGLGIYSGIFQIYSGSLLTFTLAMEVITFLLTLFLGVLAIIIAIFWISDGPPANVSAYKKATTPA